MQQKQVMMRWRRRCKRSCRKRKKILCESPEASNKNEIWGFDYTIDWRFISRTYTNFKPQLELNLQSRFPLPRPSQQCDRTNKQCCSSFIPAAAAPASSQRLLLQLVWRVPRVLYDISKVTLQLVPAHMQLEQLQ